MRHRRRGQRAQRRPDPDRRHPPPRVSRLRLLGAVRDRRRDADARPAGQHRARRRPGRAGRPAFAGRHHGHLAHALGNARRTHRGQRAPAHLRGRNRGGAQRHHRELRGAARPAEGPRLQVRHADRHRGDRAPRPRALARRRRRRPAARRAGGGRGVQGRVRDRGDLDARAGPGRRRARGQPAGRGPRRGRSLPRLRRLGAAPGHAARDLSRGGRRRRRAPGGVHDPRRARRARRAPGDRGGGERRDRGARALPPLHAEGDLRAAAGGRGHARGRGRHRPDAVRRRRAAGVDRHRQRAGARLRHQLLRRVGGEVLDREPRAHPLPGRDRERVPLPRQRAQPERAGRRRLAVGRDGRHAGGAEAREGARPPAHARDLQRRHVDDGAADEARLSHARRHRDRRRLDQGVHDAAGLAVPARGVARQGARPARRRKRRPTGCAACATCPRRCRRRSRWSRRSSPGPRPSRGSRTRCSSAAACTTRSRSKAR